MGGILEDMDLRGKTIKPTGVDEVAQSSFDVVPARSIGAMAANLVAPQLNIVSLFSLCAAGIVTKKNGLGVK